MKVSSVKLKQLQPTQHNQSQCSELVGIKTFDQSGAGIWECTPGKLQRHIAEAEFSYIIEGEGSFTTDKGEKIEFGPGDSLYFAPNTKGEWEIKTTVRKAYFIV